jgi:hypothetical protein
MGCEADLHRASRVSNGEGKDSFRIFMKSTLLQLVTGPTLPLTA